MGVGTFQVRRRLGLLEFVRVDAELVSEVDRVVVVVEEVVRVEVVAELEE